MASKFKKSKAITKDSYLKPVFNFMYYTFLSPFKIGTDGETFVLETSRFQKWGCLITHIGTLSIAVNLLLIQCHQFLSDSLNISQLLQSIGYFISAVAVTVFLKSLWLDQRSILDFLNASQVNTVHHEIVYLGSIFLALIQMLANHFNNTISDTAKLFTNALFKIPCSEENVWPFQTIFYTWAYVVILFGSILYPMGRLVMMIMSLQLRSLACEFETFLQQQVNSVRTVAQKIEWLKNTLNVGRKWTSKLLICYYICVLIFLANLPEVVRHGHFNTSEQYPGRAVEKWHAVLACFLQGLFILIACDIPERIQNSFTNWTARRFLSNEMTHEDKLFVVALTQGMEGKPLGLSCSFFTLTYNFVGSMVGLVVSYGVLVFQRNSET